VVPTLERAAPLERAASPVLELAASFVLKRIAAPTLPVLERAAAPTAPVLEGAASPTLSVLERAASPVLERVAAPTLPMVERVASPVLPTLERAASPEQPMLERAASPVLPTLERAASPKQPMLERAASPLERAASPELPVLEPAASPELPIRERAASPELPVWERAAAPVLPVLELATAPPVLATLQRTALPVLATLHHAAAREAPGLAHAAPFKLSGLEGVALLVQECPRLPTAVRISALGRGSPGMTSSRLASTGLPSTMPWFASARQISTAGSARTLFVKREGGAAWAELSVVSDMTVARLTKEIALELKLDAPMDSITLHVATVDETTGAVLHVAAAALPSRKALADIIELRAGASIVVKVAGGPSTPVPGPCSSALTRLPP